MDLSLSPVDSPTVSALVACHGAMRWSHLVSRVPPQLQAGLRIFGSRLSIKVLLPECQPASGAPPSCLCLVKQCPHAEAVG